MVNVNTEVFEYEVTISSLATREANPICYLRWYGKGDEIK